jgi:predicted O-methyltransferase YrrM
MYQEPSHIYSSYSQNNIGETIYNIVRKLKPYKVIDFGLLYGYSIVCLAQAVKDNGFGEVIGYDLFEEYEYKKSIKSIVEYNLQYYQLNKYVTLVKKDFNNWLNENEDFDLLHLDISNTGSTINLIYQKYPNKKVMFEGGIKERDNVEWMHKYQALPIQSTQTPYKILNPNFPSLSGYNIHLI